MVNKEEFDEEAYLKELENEEPISNELIQDFHNLSQNLKKLNEHYENDLLSKNDKKVNQVVEDIEKEKKLETKYVEKLSKDEKQQYLKENHKKVEKFYNSNDIATVGDNLTDKDF